MARKPATDAEKWLDRIKRAKKVKEDWKQKFRVPLAYEYLEGRQRPSYIKESEWITINMVYSNLKAILPTLYSRDPYFFVRLKRSFRPDPMLIALYEQKAVTRSSMLNYLKGELKLKDKIRLCVLDAEFMFGVMKAHVVSDLEENPDFGADMVDDDGFPMLDEGGLPLQEPRLLSTNEQYKWTRKPPDHLHVDEDPGPLDEDDSRCAQRIKRRLDDVKKDVRYESGARKATKATEISEVDEKDRQQRQKGLALAGEKNPEPEWVVTWELYDVRKNEWLTVAEGNTEFLIKPEPTPKGVEQHPFAFLRFFLRDSSWYPLPPVSQWLDPQKEYCDARSKLVTHRKRFNRKYEADVNSLGSDVAGEITKLEEGGDGTVIQVTGTQGFAAIRPITDAPLDSNHIQEIIMLRKDFEDVAVGANQRMSTQGVDSATEAGIIEKRALIQEGDDIARVADFATDAARKMDQQIQVHLTKDEAVLVEGPSGDKGWQLVRATAYDEIEGEYAYEVNIGSMLPQLPEIERAQWNAFLTTVISAPQLLLSKTLIKETARMHRIDNDRLVEELFTIGQQMMSGQIPMPGRQGSAPGSPGLPGAATGGAAGINNIRGGVQ